jgi:hypothetical protein
MIPLIKQMIAAHEMMQENAPTEVNIFVHIIKALSTMKVMFPCHL